MTASRIGAKLLALPLVILLARGLGPDGFGRWALIMSLVVVLASVADGGFQTVTVRDLAAGPERTGSYFRKTLKARLVLSVLAALGLMAWGLVAGREAGAAWPYILGGLLLFPEAVLRAGQAVFNARERMDITSGLSLAQSLATTLVVGGVVWLGLGLGGALGSLVVVNLAAAGIMVWWLMPFLRGGEVEPKSTWRLFTTAFPYGLMALLAILYFRVDVIMLAGMRGTGEAGQYNAAYRLFEAGLIIPAALTGALFPLMSRQLAALEKSKLAASFSQAVKFLVVLALPAAVACTFYSGWLTELLFGPDYGQAGRVLIVLSWSWLFFFINAPVGNLLAASDLMPRIVPWAAANTGLNIVLNLWLIPRYGPVGAALATLASEIVALAVQLFFVHRILSMWPPMFGLLIKPALASVVLLGFFLLATAKDVTPILSLLLGLVVYSGVLVVVGGLNREDRRLLSMVLPRRGGDW